jgi:hypothetical protein
MKIGLKIALGAATLTCAQHASALTFSITNNEPAVFSLPSAGIGQANRVFQFDALVIANAATSFNIELSVYDFGCAISPVCSGSYPGGLIRDSVTFLAGPDTIRQNYSLSLPANSPGEAGDVRVLFSTTGLVPLTFSDLVVTSQAPLVPEPSTWALMFAGFAMTGYALRRRPKLSYAL